MANKLTRKELKECKKLRVSLTNKELYHHIMANRSRNKNAMSYTSFRTKLYKLGLKKCEILRWTETETQYLLDNYKTIGNIEIAKNLSTKERKFTKKNVEKKMKLLKIKRTRKEINYIIQKHKVKGTYSKANYKRWEQNKAKENERRVWRYNGNLARVVIKVNGKWTPYGRYRYIQLHGLPPEGHKVYFKDGNPLNVEDDNLITMPAKGLSRELRAKYRYHSDKYFRKKKDRESLSITEPKKQVTTVAKQRIAVKIDRKTTIYVTPGTNIEAYKAKYLNRFKNF